MLLGIDFSMVFRIKIMLLCIVFFLVYIGLSAVNLYRFPKKIIIYGTVFYGLRKNLKIEIQAGRRLALHYVNS